jgi:multidrug efflux pump subunit AcrA (membrane-fusion protein)
MYVYTTITLAERKDALTLPTSAVFSQQGKSFCACVENQKIVRTPIKLGLKTSDKVEIVDGLNGTEKVIRANSAGFAAGQAVEAVPYALPKP